MPNLLIVDDETDILRALRRELYRSDWNVTSASSPKDALALIESESFDVIMSDYRMPQMTGVELLVEALRLQPAATRIVLSGFADVNAILESINNAQIFRFLVKPWKRDFLLEVLDLAWERRQEIAELDEALYARRLETDKVLREEHARRQLEALEPGITKVNFSPTDTIVLAEY